MSGNKANNLLELQKEWFTVPSIVLLNNKNSFSEISRILDCPLILRSSFALEDGIQHSFAWIFESYFPIYDEESYLKWIKKIWDFSWNSKLTYYSQFHDIKIDNFSVNIFAQEFIIWDFSWICFTDDNKWNMRLEIVPGICENLVQGNVLWPFSLLVSKTNILQYEIDSFYTDLSYIQVVSWVKREIKFDILDFEENIILYHLEKLCKIFLKIEDYFQNPQDIEFTVKGNNVYILQSRSITSPLM